MAKSQVSDREILDQIRRAEARAARSRRTEPHAKTARYDRKNRRLQVELLNGSAFSVPVSSIPDLAGVADDDLSEVTVDAPGVGLHWEKLDIDLSVIGLAQFALGTRTLLRAAGAAGGLSRSPAKARAARLNGKSGGRPRKRPAEFGGRA